MGKEVPLRPLRSPAGAIVSRLIAMIVAGYAAVTGMVALLAVLLVLLAGMIRSEAVILMSMTGFLAYAGVILWAVAEPRLRRVWIVLGVTAIASNGAAFALAPLLPSAAGG